jgi:hypothetical protein
MSPDGKTIVMLDGDKVRIWDREAGTLRADWGPILKGRSLKYGREYERVFLSPDARYMAAVANTTGVSSSPESLEKPDYRIVLIDLPNQRTVRSLEPATALFDFVDNDRVVQVAEKRLRVCELATGKMIHETPADAYPSPIRSLAFRRGGNEIVTGHAAERISWRKRSAAPGLSIISRCPTLSTSSRSMPPRPSSRTIR